MPALSLRVAGCALLFETDECAEVIDGISRAYPNSLEGDPSEQYDAHIRVTRSAQGFRVVLNGCTTELSHGNTPLDFDTFIPIILAHLRPKRFFLHASCVERCGGGVVFIGASTSGKTTLSQWLAKRHGMTLLADDVVSLDVTRQMVYPCPTTPNLRPFTRARIGSISVPPPTSDAVNPARDVLSVTHLFMLQPIGGNAVSVQPSRNWSRIYALCRGAEDETFELPSSSTRIHMPRDFVGKPELSSASYIESIRCLYRYSFPPYVPLKESLPILMRFFEKVRAVRLVPGRLEDTGQAIMNVLSG